MVTLNFVAQSGHSWEEQYVSASEAKQAMKQVIKEHGDIDRVELLDATGLYPVDIWDCNTAHAAAALGRKGGAVKSARKAATSAANGRRGGRPGGTELDAGTAAMIANPELMAALAAQDERLAAVVTAVHVDGATLADVAARFGISRERARQLRTQGLRRLRGIAKQK
mgnify:CR=1 FL=1